MADALPFASLQVLLDRLASPEVLAFLQGENLRELLSELNINLVAVEEVLVDAEEKQITNPRVERWVEKLKHAAYDAEDLLDEIATEVLRRKAVSDSLTTAETQERSIIFSGGHPFSQRAGTITERFGYLAREKDVLGLSGGGSRNLLPRRWPETSLVDESRLVGRDDDKERVVEFLLSNHSSGDRFSVISLVGMGGIGKTTLARLVYNDRRVEGCFDFRAWVCVSEEFDLVGVTKAIAKSIGCWSCEEADLNQVQMRLKECLSRKKFLIVLDDVWNENYSDWDKLQTPFTACRRGSKIMVTTRSDKVTLAMRADRHPLEVLSCEDCWSLFARHAFENGDSSSHPKLEEIGKAIAKKCKGLPLAAKTLGASLYSELHVRDWERVLKSELWDLPNDTQLLPALRLSYSFLSPQLKRCFAYCSIFPKDYVIHKENLVLLWMAEGLLQQSHRTTMEKLGDEYFNVLFSRSFFQEYGGHSSFFVMHDLINDLAQQISRKFFVHLSRRSGVPDSPRHSSYFGHCFYPFSKSGTFSNVSGLRTFLSLISHSDFQGDDGVSEMKGRTWVQEAFPSRINSRVPNGIWQKFQYLRVLSLCYHGDLDLPLTIGDDLKHLRYIDLSYTRIQKVPDSICNLHNLQTLRLVSCRFLHGLPAMMHRLSSLRHLDIRDTALQEMPGRMGELNNLQTLTLYIAGREEDRTGVGELEGLSQIGGSLKIVGLENVVDGEDALKANLIGKQYLDALCLKWDGRVDQDKDGEEIVLNNLRPHSDLKRLTIDGYGGLSFPNWLGRRGGPMTMINMVSLRLCKCDNVSAFPPLGQLLSLKHLYVEKLGEIESVGSEFFGTRPCFLHLEALSFRRMPKWRRWLVLEDEGGVFFPRLKKLCIRGCPVLRRVLPFLQMPLLTKLKIQRCNQLVVRLTRVPAIRKLIIGSFNVRQWKELPPLLQFLRIDSSEFVDEYEGTPDSEAFGSSMEVEIVDSESFESPMEVEIVDSESFESPMEEAEIQDFDSLGSLLEDGILQRDTSRLEQLIITECSFSRPLLRVCLPVTLKVLELEFLENQEFLLSELFKCQFPVLEQLTITGGSCDYPPCLIISIFPRLTNLSISGFEGPKSISFAISERDPQSSFQFLAIDGSPDVLSIELPPLNFSSCEIGYCNSLKTLLLPSPAFVQSLSISSCPKLKFPEGGLPSNLTHLIVEDCRNFTTQMEWALLPSTLTQLIIIGSEWEGLKGLPKEGPPPSALASLKLMRVPNLKSLGKGLPWLTSLGDLHVDACPDLQSLTEERLPISLQYLDVINCRNFLYLTEERLPISLQTLKVANCPNLLSLTEERLPISLYYLKITNCPLLKDRYLEGEDWHHICHIPRIVIDEQELNREVI